jgi:AcrR family transcriptional regulator
MTAPEGRRAAVVKRRVPVQQRSRDRVEQIMQAAGELLADGGVDALTTRALAEHTGIPVATIYRYFANRDAIIAAYLDHDLEEIQASLRAALLNVRELTFRSVLEAVALAHMRHHQAHPEGVPVWFGGRMNAVVSGRVKEVDERLAASWRAALRATGMLADTPNFNAELIVRLCDRMYEFVFTSDRSPDEQEAIVLSFVDMVAAYLERFAPSGGGAGVSGKQFLRALDDDSKTSARAHL